MALIVVCVPTAGDAVPPCPTTAQGGTMPAVVEAELVQAADVAALRSWGAVDWAESGQFFGAAFFVVLSIWLAAQAVGVVVRAVKQLL